MTKHSIKKIIETTAPGVPLQRIVALACVIGETNIEGIAKQIGVSKQYAYQLLTGKRGKTQKSLNLLEKIKQKAVEVGNYEET